MARKVFFSFHFANDFWRTQQVRQMNALEGNPLATANAWEEVKRKGDDSIKKWIADEMTGRSCIIVLVGSETAARKWVKYEIEKAWKDNRAVLGIRIHNLLDTASKPSPMGANPFEGITVGTTKLGQAVPLKNPSGADSKAVYATIASNIEAWIEEAIERRKA
ncbi:TIR domain-containing protein [Pigmentiphaga sp.]|uniref:TIR domain-containing protein n=1 Tax=Pigmentiphaga sp. TaxID=1977564 RepID=UPI0025DA718A|nr:TIR domain-containing protein [Pigmentiphaga sp.]